MAHIWVPKPRFRPAHSAKLEKWYGAEQIANISQAMKPWYGPGIPLSHCPGNVVALKGGDFAGQTRVSRYVGEFARRMSRAALLSERYLNVGFTSLSDILAEASAGKRREFLFNKVGAVGVVGGSNSLLQLGATPVAAANAAAAPGGVANVDSNVGFPLFANPTGTDTLHVVSAFGSASVINNSLLLYDCIFRVDKTMNSTATEAVTGVPTRYQNTVAGSVDSAEGNFLFVQVGLTVLAATAHNWTVCLYTDQAGVASTLPSLTGNASAIVHRLDHPVQQWFAPLEAGDTGIKVLTQMQASALVATGVINFVIGHPIAWMMFPVINFIVPFNYINSMFNLNRIFDDAALALLEVMKPATGGTTYNVHVVAVAG